MNPDFRIVDISMPLTADYKMHTPAGVKDVQLQLEVIKEHDAPDGAGQMVRALHARLHHGTHVDAPEHFVKGGKQISDLELATFVGPAVIADVRHVGPGNEIQPSDLAQAIEGIHRPGDRLLVRTDWTDNYGQPNYVDDSPFLGLDALDWCREMQFPLVGMDFAHTKDPDDAPGRYYTTRFFCENDIVTMGYVYGLAGIANPRVFLVAVPLAIHGAEASPVRAIVFDGAL